MAITALSQLLNIVACYEANPVYLWTDLAKTTHPTDGQTVKVISCSAAIGPDVTVSGNLVYRAAGQGGDANNRLVSDGTAALQIGTLPTLFTGNDLSVAMHIKRTNDDGCLLNWSRPYNNDAYYWRVNAAGKFEQFGAYQSAVLSATAPNSITVSRQSIAGVTTTDGNDAGIHRWVKNVNGVVDAIEARYDGVVRDAGTIFQIGGATYTPGNTATEDMLSFTLYGIAFCATAFDATTINDINALAVSRGAAAMPTAVIPDTTMYNIIWDGHSICRGAAANYWDQTSWAGRSYQTMCGIAGKKFLFRNWAKGGRSIGDALAADAKITAAFDPAKINLLFLHCLTNDINTSQAYLDSVGRTVDQQSQLVVDIYKQYVQRRLTEGYTVVALTEIMLHRPGNDAINEQLRLSINAKLRVQLPALTGATGKLFIADVGADPVMGAGYEANPTQFAQLFADDLHPNDSAMQIISTVTGGVSADAFESALPKAATPTINPANGTVASGIVLTFATTTNGASLHYTLDDTPVESDSLFYNPAAKPALSNNTNAPITVKVRVRAFADGFNPSDERSATLTVSPVPVDPSDPEITGVKILLAGQEVTTVSVTNQTSLDFDSVVEGSGDISQSGTWSKQSGAGSVNSSGVYPVPARTNQAQTAVLRFTASDGTHYAQVTITIPAATVDPDPQPRTAPPIKMGRGIFTDPVALTEGDGPIRLVYYADQPLADGAVAHLHLRKGSEVHTFVGSVVLGVDGLVIATVDSVPDAGDYLGAWEVQNVTYPGYPIRVQIAARLEA